MNRNTLSPSHPDELDRLFSAYFKAQVPANWPLAPSAKAEASSHVATVQHADQRGRVTLAASVACLLGLGLALSYGPTHPGPANPSGELLKSGSADGKELQKHMAPESRPRLPMP